MRTGFATGYMAASIALMFALLFVLIKNTKESAAAPTQKSANKIVYLGTLNDNVDLYKFYDEFDSHVTCYLIEGKSNFAISVSCINNIKDIK